MEIVWHFACYGTDKLQNYLLKNKIRFDREEILPALSGWIYFDISECHPAFMQIQKLCGQDTISTYKVRYNKTELENARWLTFDSHIDKIDLSREDVTFFCTEVYDNRKAHHRYLSGSPFYVSKPPKHTKQQHFFCSSMATSYLFCTEYAKQNLSEISNTIICEPVLSVLTNQPVGDLFYMNFAETIPESAMDLSNVEEVYACPVCQKQTYLPPVQLRIRQEFLNNDIDFCKTADIFSFGGNFSFHINIVSQRVYKEIKQRAIGRGLEFSPIQLI